MIAKCPRVFLFFDALLLVAGQGDQGDQVWLSPPPAPPFSTWLRVFRWKPNPWFMFFAPRLALLFVFGLGQVVNIPNSMTVLTDLLPVSLAMADKKLEVRTEPDSNLPYVCTSMYSRSV